MEEGGRGGGKKRSSFISPAFLRLSWQRQLPSCPVFETSRPALVKFAPGDADIRAPVYFFFAYPTPIIFIPPCVVRTETLGTINCASQPLLPSLELQTRISPLYQIFDRPPPFLCRDNAYQLQITRHGARPIARRVQALIIGCVALGRFLEWETARRCGCNCLLPR